MADVCGFSRPERAAPIATRYVVITRCGGARAALALGFRGLVLTIAGELDVQSQPGLTDVVDLAGDCRRPVEVNLAAVRFTDSNGLDPLLSRLSSPLRPALGAVRFGAVSPHAARVLDLLDVPYTRVVIQSWPRPTD